MPLSGIQHRINDWEFVRGDLGGVWEALRDDAMSNGLPLNEEGVKHV